MLYFDEYKPALHCREFVFTGETDIFHKALTAICRGGEKRFHVMSPEHGNFDLVYQDNDDEMRRSGAFNEQLLPEQFGMFAPFLSYDENRSERLFLNVFDGIDRVCFARLNEYTVILCKVLLNFTDKKIIFNDDRIHWFFQDERISVTGDLPQEADPGCLTVTSSFFDQDPVWNTRIHDINLFSTVFFIDALTDLDIEQIKYVSLYIDRIEGIGAILINYLKAKKFFSKFGFEIYIREKSSRYDDELLRKYFRIGNPPADSDETNTIYIPNYFGIVFTCAIDKMLPHSDIHEVMNDTFIDHMDEYRKAVFGNRKVLGLMVRGTDYKTAKINVQPIAMDRLIAIVKEKLEKEHYDLIFLATEDKDKLDELLRAFPGKIVAIAQERYRLSDFSDGITVISEVEKKNRTATEHRALLEDTTVNYCYAIYLLTWCDAFIATPFTNGVRCVLTFNQREFASQDILNDSL